MPSKWRRQPLLRVAVELAEHYRTTGARAHQREKQRATTLFRIGAQFMRAHRYLRDRQYAQYQQEIPPLRSAINRAASMSGSLEGESWASSYEFDHRQYVYALQGLAHFFPRVEFQLASRHQQVATRGNIVVTTPPIELEGIEFGAFELSSPYPMLLPPQARALTPRYPVGAGTGRASHYPHPHISGTSICLGEAKPDVENAAKYGDVLALFRLTLRVLQNYGASPYVSLGYWRGAPCPSCGRQRGPGVEFATCALCPTQQCADCESPCVTCDNSFCRDHIAPCRRCSEPVCANCATEGYCPVCEVATRDERKLAAAREAEAAQIAAARRAARAEQARRRIAAAQTTPTPRRRTRRTTR